MGAAFVAPVEHLDVPGLIAERPAREIAEDQHHGLGPEEFRERDLRPAIGRLEGEVGRDRVQGRGRAPTRRARGEGSRTATSPWSHTLLSATPPIGRAGGVFRLVARSNVSWKSESVRNPMPSLLAASCRRTSLRAVSGQDQVIGRGDPAGIEELVEIGVRHLAVRIPIGEPECGKAVLVGDPERPPRPAQEADVEGRQRPIAVAVEPLEVGIGPRELVAATLSSWSRSRRSRTVSQSNRDRAAPS